MKDEIEKNTKTGLDAIIKCAEANVAVKILEANQALLSELRSKVDEMEKLERQHGPVFVDEKTTERYFEAVEDVRSIINDLSKEEINNE